MPNWLIVAVGLIVGLLSIIPLKMAWMHIQDKQWGLAFYASFQGLLFLAIGLASIERAGWI